MFYDKYVKTVMEKGSFININLDPALPEQRGEMVIPSRFISEDDFGTLLNFSLDVIDQVSDFSCSVKLNTQYFLGAYGALTKIVKKIHEEGMIAILDHKLSDIGATNDSALYWISKMGFDAFTFSPFAGNINATVKNAHRRKLGVVILTLMSNPEAKKIMVDTIIDDKPYYLHIAEMVKASEADGCVIGLTDYVKDEYVKNVQKTIGGKTVVLLQGLGPQGGKIDNIKHVINPLVSLGRTVIYSPEPRKTLQRYREKLKSIRSAATG
ncbi:MAG: orotidine 5'-phosphate decarboxylase [Candidatus Bathyarchaeota archaeon]|jgi:orotidine-5'-phosphate decarboxylase